MTPQAEAEMLDAAAYYEGRAPGLGSGFLEGYLRVVDEAGEDYLYPKEFFAPVELPANTERALATAGAARSRPVR